MSRRVCGSIDRYGNMSVSGSGGSYSSPNDPYGQNPYRGSYSSQQKKDPYAGIEGLQDYKNWMGGLSARPKPSSSYQSYEGSGSYSGRSSWRVGSTVEIYSNTMFRWYAGTVMSISSRNGEDMLLVSYDGGRSKKIGRNHQNIREFLALSNVPEKRSDVITKEVRNGNVYTKEVRNGNMRLKTSVNRSTGAQSLSISF